MSGFVHGKHTGILVDGTDLSELFTELEASGTQEVSDVTTFRHDREDRVYIPGIRDGSLSVSGFYDPDRTGPIEELPDQVVVTCCPASATVPHTMAILVGAQETTFNVPAPIGGAVAVSAAFQPGARDARGLRVGGILIQELVTIDSTFDGDYHDRGAATTAGVVAHLHVVDFDGTNVDIRLQHTDDDPDVPTPVWADLVAWEGITAPGGYRAIVAGTVERYLRVVADGGTFTDVTYAVAAARY